MRSKRLPLVTRAALAAALAAGLAAVAPQPAQAHTNIVLAGNQVVGGGEVNGYGAADNVVLNDGPASDGTVIFSNLDPVAHHLVGDINVVVPAGAQVEIKLSRGDYEFHDAAQPTMRGRVRVTGSH